MGDVFDVLDRRQGVRRTGELERVAKLPRRKIDLTNVVDLTEEFLIKARCFDGGCDLCDGGKKDARLTPAQSLALAEARERRGLFAELPVGSGKTLLGILLGVATRGERPVFLMPPRTYRQVRDVQLPRIARHFRVNPDLELVPYSRLRQKDGAQVLPRLRPDRLILDEAHAMRYRTSKQTKAVLWFMKSNPSTLCYLMTGTPGSKLEHYYHLLDLALRTGSPLPRRYHEVNEWGQAADEDAEERLAPGALTTAFPETCAVPGCGRPATRHHEEDEDGVDARGYCQGHSGGKYFDDVVLARRAIRQRYRETPGVAWAPADDCPASLVLVRSKEPKEDSAVRAVRLEAEKTWVIEDEEIPDGVAMWRLQRQLALGFYYRWRWPFGQKDHVWLQARQEWNRACRDYLSRAARPGVDSEGTLRAAVRAGEVPHLKAVLDNWHAAQRGKPDPETEPVWLSMDVVHYAAAWAKRTGGVVWYEPIAFGAALRGVSDVPALGQGEQQRVLELAGRPRGEKVPVALSFAHAEGMNLQRWDRALVLSVPSGAKKLEQLLGRHHRRGQKSDEVIYTFGVGTPAMGQSLDAAIAEARETQQKLTARQKVLSATWGEDYEAEET